MQKKRTYNLKRGGGKPAKGSLSETMEKIVGESLGVTFVDAAPPASEENLPTMREVGQQVEFEYLDKLRYGTVVAVKSPSTCLIEDREETEGGVFYEHNSEITYLPISAACPHCSGFAFQCNKECPAKARKPRTNKPMQEPKLIPLSEVIAMPPGYINDRFQAIVTVETKFDAKTGEPYHKAKLVQAGSPSISIAAKFWGDTDITPLNGKLVEFCGSGLQRTEYKPEKSPRPIQQVSISEKMKSGELTNNWKIIGESADADKPLPHPATSSQPATKSAAASGSGVNGGGSEGVLPESPVSQRVHDYLMILGEVKRQVNGTEADLPWEAVKDIATHISMTYRGQYGSYRPPVFAAGAGETSAAATGYSEKELKNQPDQTWGEPEAPATEVVEDWRDHVYNGKKLGGEGGRSKSELIGLIKWDLCGARAGRGDPEVARRLSKNLKRAEAELKLTSLVKCATALLMQHGYGHAFHTEDIEASFNILDDGACLEIIKDPKAAAQKCIAAKEERESANQAEDNTELPP